MKNKLVLSTVLVLLNSCVGQMTNNIDAKIDSTINASANANTNVDTKVKTGDINTNIEQKNNPKQVVSINVFPTTINLAEGEETNIVGTVKYSDNSSSSNVAWNTSNSFIVKVDSNGKVKAMSSGNAVITGVAQEDATKTITINVSVNKVNLTSPIPTIGTTPTPVPTTTPTPLPTSNVTPTPVPTTNPTPVPTSTITPTPVPTPSIEIIQSAPTISGMTFVVGGTFTMGDTIGGGNSDEKPLHQVTLSSFYIANYEVTQKEYQTLIGNNPAEFKGDNSPVEWVSWFDAIKYCNKKSKAEGLLPAYNESTGVLLDSSGNVTTDVTKVKGYRLPTEAEWEYAAKGGNKTQGYKYSGSNNVGDVAIYNTVKTSAVGTKLPNELGLYDMSGNVWEWTSDAYQPYTSSNSINPYFYILSGNRVLRGGSWDHSSDFERSSNRDYYAGNGSSSLGIRIVKSTP